MRTKVRQTKLMISIFYHEIYYINYILKYNKVWVGAKSATAQNELNKELKLVTTIERIIDCVGHYVQRIIFVEQKTVIKLV
jgi:hypothetical protein